MDYLRAHPTHDETTTLRSSPHLLILGQDIRHRPKRRNRKLINLLMTLRIMFLDVLEIRRLTERRQIPIEATYPAMNGGEPRADITQITFEMLDVDRVEANDGCEEADIGLGDGFAEEKGRGGELLGQVSFDFIQRGKKRRDGFFVRFLRGCEAGFVDAVVDIVVDPFVGGVDGTAVGCGEEVDFLVLFWDEVVEFMVEHSDDFGALGDLRLVDCFWFLVSWFVPRC